MADINNSANQVYYDALISSLGLNVASPNLLEGATITIGESPTVSLTYKCKYDQKFQIAYNNVAQNVYGASDFIARTAKNYDCRFYITDGADNLLRVLSGSISINISYTKFYLANTESEYPIYAPQSYEVSGTLVVPTNNFEVMRNLFNSKVVTYANFSLLIGSRYLRLGQTVIEDRLNMTMGDNLRTAEISFKGYARL